jgi:AAA15 family ATPase/GTPase
MKIKSLQLKNFKRFTDLTLQDIPENAKLVLLIGSNGSGKSSVFDAFELFSDLIHRSQSQTMNPMNFSGGKDYQYYHKGNSLLDINLNFTNNHIRCYFKDFNSGFVDKKAKFLPNAFYGRSAVRYLSRLTKTSIGETINIAKDADKPNYYIDEDKRFSNDIDLLIKDVVDKIFKGINTDSTQQLDEIKLFLEKINDAFPRIFGSNNGTKLSFKSFSPPAEGKPSQLIFLKGISEISYNLLSAGEKEIVNLLFNLFVRTKFYNDTVYFMDEVDTHLNTTLQYSLLKEITENWIPENCQFWTASHSLGFIQYATEYDNGCIIDFDDLDFDKKQILSPKAKDDFEIFEIAVSKSFIDQVIQGRKIIFSENSDTPFYNDLNIANTFFFVAIDKIDVFHKAKNHKQYGLIDRDYLSDKEVIQLKEDYPGLFFLPYYSFENLLYHPDNLEEYYNSIGKPFDKQAYIDGIITLKNNERDYLAAGIIQARGGYPFYKENENAKKLKTFKETYKGVIELMRSDDFETFYKVFPAKDYGREMPERLGVSPAQLAKTNWFKQQIQNILKNL